MGNQQTKNTFGYEDIDSGYSEQNSPFEYDSSQVNSLFGELNRTQDSSIATFQRQQTHPSPAFTSTPRKATNPNSIEYKINNITDSILNEEIYSAAPPANLMLRRRSSVARSQNIAIAKSPNSFLSDDELDDEFSEHMRMAGSLKSNTSYMSVVSNSWSPNSTIPTKPKPELAKTKSVSEKTTPTNKSYPLTNSFVSGMNFVGRVAKGVKDFYNEINPATLTGAIDVVVVKQEDGTYKCSPFHVRFGKLGVIRSKEKIVDIEINGQKVDDLHMVLGEAGEAFFIERINNSGEVELSTCSEFENCSLPAETPLSLTAKHDYNIPTLDSTNEETQKLSSCPNIQVTLEKTNLNNSDDLQNISGSEESSGINVPTETLPIAIKSAPVQASSSLSSLPMSPGSPSIQDMKLMSQSLKPSLLTTDFFSDGDITPELTSPAFSRPSTPKSDTELEIAKFKRDKNSSSSLTSESNQWNWNWGQFPERQNPKTTNKVADKVEKKQSTDKLVCDKAVATSSAVTAVEPASSLKPKEGSSSSSKILDGVLGLVSKSKKTHDGIYLDETGKLDSEVADLYLNQKATCPKQNPTSSMVPIPAKQQSSCQDDDQESGNGLSLPQSPVNAPYLGDIQLSLCGFMSAAGSSISSSTQNLLNTSMNFSEICSQSPPSSPISLSAPLTLQSSSSSHSLNKELASSPTKSNAITPTNELANINNNNNFEDLFQQYAVSFEKFLADINTITQNPNLVIKINNQYMNWQAASPIILSALVFQKPLSCDSVKSIMEANMPKVVAKQAVEDSKKASSSGWGKNLFGWGGKSKSAEPNMASTTIEQKQTVTTTTTTTITHTSPSDTEEYGAMFKADWGNGKTEIKNKVEVTQSQEASITQVVQDLNEDQTPAECKSFYKHRSTSTVDFNEFTLKKDLYRKSTRLSSSIIEKLNLKMGQNEIEYSITTALQGTTRITSYIFLWNYDDKIIVSDIDGTITKSDVWGQVLPIFGRDWSQDGVADLFTAIERNHYKFMYLSARAIGQSKITRDLLKNINQDGFTLPEGPLLVTPSSLFVAFQKEVIERKPEEFKISCLSDIKALFPCGHEVFYAGYGNKPTDVTAYKAVGMPVSRIFTINPQGEVKGEHLRTFQSSYSKLCDYVDLMFPPKSKVKDQMKIEYDTFNYWRSTTIDSLPNIDLELKQEMEKEASSSNSESKSSKSKPQSLNTSLQNTSGPAQTSDADGSKSSV